jgi:hypothetical protein
VPADEPGPLGYKPDNLEPRAYRLPYSRELHAVVERANRLLREGRRVELREVVQPRGAHGAPRLQAHPLVIPAPRKETVSRP